MAEGPRPPEGTIAFVFTDIEGSTRRWELNPDGMSAALRRHDQIIRSMFERHGGCVFKSTGDGFCAAFPRPDHALFACVDAQLALEQEPWPLAEGLKVRMAVHSGPADRYGEDYIGPTLNRIARILNLGHGGQILASSTCEALAGDLIGPNIELNPLGEFELDGLLRPERVFQVVANGLSSEFPPLRSRLPGRPEAVHNIEIEPRPFFGRGTECQELRDRLLGHERLVTLTGIGGIGKSRLAKEVALSLIDSFPEGVRLVHCDALTGRDEIVAATLHALGCEPGHESPERRLAEFLSQRRLLLVFDCFEGLVDHADLLDTLLRAAPSLRCLVTSRTVLGSEWEYEFPVGPLSGPRKPDDLPAATALFQDAARHVQAGFRITRGNRALVASIVRELENVPLALVLAAGRLRHLTLTELKEQVSSHKLDVLRRRPVGHDRHATLLQVIEGTFVLLSPEDRRLACALSVFEGGFALEDAVAVLEGWAEPMEGISRLRDHSLLVTSASGPHMRYRALDTVREYLSGAESSEALDEVRRRHARHFAGRAQEVRSLFEAGQWQAASAKLWPDAGNFRAATRYAVASGEPSLIRAFAASLARCFMEAGARSEFEVLCRASEAIAGDTDDPSFAAEMLGLRGEFERRSGHPTLARKLWERRMALGAKTGDAELEVDALIDLAELAMNEGDLPRAVELGHRFDALDSCLAKDYLRASGYVLKAKLAMLSADSASALASAEKAAKLTEGPFRDTSCFFIGANLADVFRRTGRMEEARAMNHRLLGDALDNNWPHFAVKMLFELADFERSCSRPDEAARALTLASMVPRSQALSLRDEAKRRTAEFERELGSEGIERALEWAKGRSWVDAAMEFTQDSV